MLIAKVAGVAQALLLAFLYACIADGQTTNPQPDQTFDMAVGTSNITLEGFKLSVTWDQARTVCKSRGGDLVRGWRTRQEDALIEAFCMSLTSTAGAADERLGCWIGLRASSDGTFASWVDGSLQSLDGWWKGGEVYGTFYRAQPDRQITWGTAEDCVAMWRLTGGWHDMPCAGWEGKVPFYFICSVPSTGVSNKTSVDSNGTLGVVVMPGNDTGFNSADPSPSPDSLSIALGVANTTANTNRSTTPTAAIQSRALNRTGNGAVAARPALAAVTMLALSWWLA